MSDRPSVSGITDPLESSVRFLQLAIAAFLTIGLVIGVVNLVASFVQAAVAVELFGYGNAVGLISTTIDIVLYLFIVIELFRTIITYVEAKSVVRAVVHAGLIAVVRQMIIFKPEDVGSPMEALFAAGTLAIMLVALLLGFYLVHRPGELE